MSELNQPSGKIQKRAATDFRSDVHHHWAYMHAGGFAQGKYPVLDAGCGNGKNTVYMLRRGLDVHGIDINPDHLDIAAREFPKLKGRLVEGDITQLPYSNSVFGAVYSGAVLFGLPDKEKFGRALSESARVSVPNSYFFGRTLSSSLDGERLSALEAARDKDGEIEHIKRHLERIRTGVYSAVSARDLEHELGESGFGQIIISESPSRHDLDPRRWLYFSARAGIR